MSNTKTKLWDRVCETDPNTTKKVNQRGGFTAIDAQSQVHTATKTFGAFGTGWGIKDERIQKWEDAGLAVYEATLWYIFEGSKTAREFPIHSSIRYITNGRVDDDFYKKVATDALTKGLSKLGFNADVFLGKFDDNKYVNTMTKKFSVESTDSVKSALSTVKSALKGIPKDDDFYVKVIHALDKGQIGNGNLESSIKKINDYKEKMKELQVVEKLKKELVAPKLVRTKKTTTKIEVKTGDKNDSATKQ
jgi:hypothetical protein